VRWLIGKGKVEKSLKILKHIASVNGNNVSDEVYASFEVRTGNLKFPFYLEKRLQITSFLPENGK
jgi:hypothetical protein